MSQRLSAKAFESLQARAKHRCEYCLSPEKFSPQDFEVEHIEPESRGGQTVLKNLALICRGCNGHKYNKTSGLDPLTWELVPLFNPRKHTWAEHFAWDADPAYLLGLTPTGRASIEVLKLIRPKLIRPRGLLMRISEHPPVD